MAGIDTVRGIAYQHAQAILTSIQALEDNAAGSIRVEGIDDFIDIEVRDQNGRMMRGQQVKTRIDRYTWSQSDLIRILRKWDSVSDADDASFEFVTDGRLAQDGQALAYALRNSSSDGGTALATILRCDPDDSICQVSRRARIVQDRSSTTSILQQAQWRLLRYIPKIRSGEEGTDVASRAIDRLFRLLSIRAAEADPKDRSMSREELAACLNVPLSAFAPSTWDLAHRDRFLLAAKRMPDQAPVVSIRFTHVDRSTVVNQAASVSGGAAPAESPEAISPASLLAEKSTTLLSGTTGSGKTTAAKFLQCLGVENATPVVRIRAESYVPGRLTRQVADSIMQVTESVATVETASSFLADPTSILVIDGASEIPASDRQGLSDELRIVLTDQLSVRIFLIGRDQAILRSILPGDCDFVEIIPVPWGWDERRTLASAMLAESDHVSTTAHALSSQIETNLEGAADNPFMFSTSARLLLGGAEFRTRSDMYARLMESFAERGRLTSVDVMLTILGSVYCGLLDEGRRYCDQIEWQLRLRAAEERLLDLGIFSSAKEVHKASMQAGLIVATGTRQIITPTHDSIADYLAAAAHARGIIPMPVRLDYADTQRIEFLAEMRGIDGSLAKLLMSCNPFLGARLSIFDTRAVSTDSLSEIVNLLSFALKPPFLPNFLLWLDPLNRVVASVRTDVHETDFVEAAVGREALTKYGGIVCLGGPLAVAVSLWRFVLKQNLESPRGLAPARIIGAAEAAGQLLQHALGEATELEQTIRDLSPPGHEDELSEAVGPLGLTAVVSPDPTFEPLPGWSVTYRRSDAVSIEIGPSASADLTGWSLVEHLLRDTPSVTAKLRVAQALDELVSRRWIT